MLIIVKVCPSPVLMVSFIFSCANLLSSHMKVEIESAFFKNLVSIPTNNMEVEGFPVIATAVGSPVYNSAAAHCAAK